VSEEASAEKAAAPTIPTDKKGKQTPELIRRRRESKKAFCLRAYQKTANISASCQLAGIHRDTFYEWIKKDPRFKKRVEETRETVLDNAETRLMSFIKEGNVIATIFFLKCQGKSRGYVERQEITGKNGGPVAVDRTEEVLRNLTDGELDTIAAIMAKGARPLAEGRDEGASEEASPPIH
jgi:hypothetical protein